jgi:hypothetical protein
VGWWQVINLTNLGDFGQFPLCDRCYELSRLSIFICEEAGLIRHAMGVSVGLVKRIDVDRFLQIVCSMRIRFFGPETNPTFA